MPEGSKEIRADHIRKIQNTEVEITDKNYDNTVKEVKELCEKDPNGIMIQDTAWEGYEKIPGWIIKGYGLIVDEFLKNQLISFYKLVWVLLQLGLFQVQKKE